MGTHAVSIMETSEWDEPYLEALESPDLPGKDMEPVYERERIQTSLGIESLYHYWQDRDDFYVAGNMFLYYSISQMRAVTEELETLSLPKRAFSGPGMFVALGVDRSYRQKWVVWEKEGRYPNVIFEFLSPDTCTKEMDEKKRLYERTFRTREYFCFDYMNPMKIDSLTGCRLDGQGHYQAITANKRGWLWSEELNLWVGRWPGIILRDDTVWMRFYTPEGELVQISAEAEQQRADQEARRAEKEVRKAEKEAQRAEQLAAQLRAAGIEPDG